MLAKKKSRSSTSAKVQEVDDLTDDEFKKRLLDRKEKLKEMFEELKKKESELEKKEADLKKRESVVLKAEKEAEEKVEKALAREKEVEERMEQAKAWQKENEDREQHYVERDAWFEQEKARYASERLSEYRKENEFQKDDHNQRVVKLKEAEREI